MLFIGDDFAVVQVALESSHNQCRKELAQDVPLGDTAPARRVAGITLTLRYEGKETHPLSAPPPTPNHLLIQLGTDI